VYDLIIIGGGMSGLSVAYHFRNQNILLLEKDYLLSGATGNNAGYLITGFGEHFNRTAARCGLRRAREIQEIHLASHEMLRAIIKERLSTDPEIIADCGSISVAFNEQETADLRASYQSMLSEGFPVEWISESNVGLNNKMPALFNPTDAIFNAQTFWNSIAGSLPVKTKSAVTGVFEENDHLVVVTPKEELQAKNVVYCLNAFSAKLLPEFEGRLIPLRGQMVELPLLNASPLTAPCISNYGEIYWNFTPTTLRFGGLEYLSSEDETGIATGLSQKILHAQLEWIERNFEPGLVSPIAIKAWYSTMAFTVDGFPFVGRIPGKRNQYTLCGLCGLGNSYAMVCASWLYELIARDVNVIPAYFSNDRMNRLPKYSGGDWRSLYEAWNHGIH
jgi:glycine/D-amino acid oxidase-like deaminating enzyme